jgi:hypothetical protein
MVGLGVGVIMAVETTKTSFAQRPAFPEQIDTTRSSPHRGQHILATAATKVITTASILEYTNLRMNLIDITPTPALAQAATKTKTPPTLKCVCLGEIAATRSGSHCGQHSILHRSLIKAIPATIAGESIWGFSPSRPTRPTITKGTSRKTEAITLTMIFAEWNAQTNAEDSSRDIVLAKLRPSSHSGQHTRHRCPIGLVGAEAVTTVAVETT